MHNYLKTVFLLTFVLIAGLLYSQAKNDIGSMLIGKWVFTKRIANNKPQKISKQTYTFKNDNSFELIMKEKEVKNKDVVIKGKWNLSNNNDTIHLYEDYKYGGKDKSSLFDNLIIIKLTNKELIAQELSHEGEYDNEGINYYKRK